MKSSKVSRVVKLLTTLQSGKKYKINELTKMLNISRRTVFRDLNELDAIGVPYYYDSKSGGYAIEPSYYLKPMDFNLQEALSLLMLVHKAREYVSIPFKDAVLMAGLKIENNLPSQVRRYCNTTLKNVSFKPCRYTPTEKIESVFNLLQKAICEKWIFQMKYHSLYEDSIIKLDLHPYHLLYNHRAWYVLGFSDMHKQVRTFKLSRIVDCEISKTKFVDDEKFDPDEYLGRAWQMIPEGRLWNIKLEFDKMVAHNVSEVRWHDTQQIKWNDDGSVEMEFRVDGLGEISWWVLGYGDKVKVLAPTKLRKMVLGRAEKMVENFMG